MTWLKVAVLSVVVFLSLQGLGHQIDPTIDALCEVTQP